MTWTITQSKEGDGKNREVDHMAMWTTTFFFLLLFLWEIIGIDRVEHRIVSKQPKKKRKQRPSDCEDDIRKYWSTNIRKHRKPTTYENICSSKNDFCFFVRFALNLNFIICFDVFADAPCFVSNSFLFHSFVYYFVFVFPSFFHYVFYHRLRSPYFWWMINE